MAQNPKDVSIADLLKQISDLKEQISSMQAAPAAAATSFPKPAKKLAPAPGRYIVRGQSYPHPTQGLKKPGQIVVLGPNDPPPPPGWQNADTMAVVPGRPMPGGNVRDRAVGVVTPAVAAAHASVRAEQDAARQDAGVE